MDNLKYLSFDVLPEFIASSFRYFYPREKHVNRITNQDVLLLVFSGILRFSENGIPVEVSAGQYYIQKANVVQEGIVESNSPKYYYIHFYGTYTDDNTGISISGNFSFNEIKELLFGLDNLLKLQATRKLEIALAFYNILQKLKSMNVIDKKEESLANIMEKNLSEKYNEAFSLSLIEKKFGYSKDYLIRLFRKTYGVTPHQYITELRMNQARQLLMSTNRTVLQIAEECGYNDLSAFYRIFIKMHDCSPKEWKNKMLNI
jgi:AraC-like DNA-binding protein